MESRYDPLRTLPNRLLPGKCVGGKEGKTIDRFHPRHTISFESRGAFLSRKEWSICVILSLLANQRIAFKQTR